MERLLNQVGLTEPLERKLPARVGQTGFEFVFACLQMDPAKRPNCDELLQHDYIQSAQMTQFVRGTSHASTGPTGTEQVTLGTTSRVAGLPVTMEPPSSRSSHSSLGSKRSQAAGARDTGRVMQPNRNELVARSNSQAILMIANNKKQHQQQQQRQQPASKRLVIASDSGLIASPKGYQSSPKHSGSLVPVPVRTSRVSSERRSSQARTNLYSSTGADIQLNRQGQYGKPKGPIRGDRQKQSNLVQQTGHATSTASSKSGQQQRANSIIFRMTDHKAGYPNTNSSASSSPTTSFGTGKSSSISFLPSVKQC